MKPTVIIFNVDVDIIQNNDQSSYQLTQRVNAGQIRFVLSWPNAPKDLDIHSIFKVSRYTQCEVYFGERECLGMTLDTDNLKGGKNGVETITIDTLGNYIYIFVVNKYFDVSDGETAAGDNFINQEETSKTTPINNSIPNIPLSQSKATLSIYTSEFKGPLHVANVPTFNQENLLDPGKEDSSYIWWIAFCMDGSVGIDSLKTVNLLSTEKPPKTYCDSIVRPA